MFFIFFFTCRVKKSREMSKARKEIFFGSPLSTPNSSPASSTCTVTLHNDGVERREFCSPTNVPRMRKALSTTSHDSGISAFSEDRFTDCALPKDFKKRTSELHKKFTFRKAPMRCAVAIHHLLRVKKSPRTKWAFPQIAAQIPGYQRFLSEAFSCHGFIQLQKKLNSDLRCIVALRKKGVFSKILKIVSEWKQKKLSIRFVSRVTDVTLSYLQWLVKLPCTTSSRKVRHIDRKRTIEFFGKTNVTMQLPLKRHAHKYFFRTALDPLYKIYKQNMRENGYRVLSKSAVLRVLPRKFFKTVDKVPIQGCLCMRCENFRLILCALMAACVKGFSRQITRSALLSVCNPDGNSRISNVAAACLNRSCENCKLKVAEIFNDENPDLDMNKMCVWHQWQSDYKFLSDGTQVRTKCRKVLQKGSVQQLINLAKLIMIDMPQHLFDVEWQADQFEKAKKALVEGEVLTVMDFAKNFNLPRQREVQYAFFCRESITLHPVVCYFLCPQGCGNVLCDEVMMFSSDTKHDSHAVNAFQNKAIEHLETTYNFKVKKLISFTDNCSGQYKCHQAFAYMTHCDVLVERHYFGPGHGKGPGDASVGRVKRELDLAIRGGQADIQSVPDLAKHCQRKLTTTVSNDFCAHRQRHFYLVNKIDRSFQSPYDTLTGTMSYHCIKATGTEGEVFVRLSSCFCR
jgi:hypothetical protein